MCILFWLITSGVLTSIVSANDDELALMKQSFLNFKSEVKAEIWRLEAVIENQAAVIHRLESDTKSTLRDKRQAESYSFTAYLVTEHIIHPGNIIKYDGIINNEGSMYNRYTGVVTIPVTGTYIFSFSFEDYHIGGQIVASLKVDGVNQVDAIINRAGGSEQAGNTAILYLRQGQSVWVEIDKEGLIYGRDDERLTTFTGALLV